MKGARVYVIFLIFVLSMSMVSALMEIEEINIETEEPTVTGLDDYESIFSLSTEEGQIILTPNYDLEELVVFIDGQRTTTVNNPQKDEDIVMDVKKGEHSIEVRYLNTYTYEWEDYDITENDEPATLKYLQFDKSNKLIKLGITGAVFVHPDKLDSTELSFQETYQDFSVTLNEDVELDCYPTITTGKDIYFKCKTKGVYPNKVDVEVEVVSRETFSVFIKRQNAITGHAVEEEAMAEENVTETIAVETTQEEIVETSMEVPVLDNIEVIDTISTVSSVPHGPVMFLVLAAFLASMVIMYIDSHHKHLNKVHGVRKKK